MSMTPSTMGRPWTHTRAGVDFHCRPTLKGLLRQIEKLEKGFLNAIFWTRKGTRKGDRFIFGRRAGPYQFSRGTKNKADSWERREAELWKRAE